MATKPAAPKKPAPAATPATAPAAPEKQKRSRLPIIIAVVLVLAAGAAGGWYWTQEKAAAHAASGPVKPRPNVFTPVEAFTVNLATTSMDRFLQVGMTLETEGDAVELLKRQMPVIRGRLLLLLTAKTAEELGTIDGKQKLMNEILGEVRAVLPAGARPDRGVARVHFSSFVIQ